MRRLALSSCPRFGVRHDGAQNMSPIMVSRQMGMCLMLNHISGNLTERVGPSFGFEATFVCSPTNHPCMSLPGGSWCEPGRPQIGVQSDDPRGRRNQSSSATTGRGRLNSDRPRKKNYRTRAIELSACPFWCPIWNRRVRQHGQGWIAR